MLFHSTPLIAFDTGAVSGAVVSWGWNGPRLHAFARAGLAPGAIVASAVEPNVTRPQEVTEALEAVRAGIGHVARATVVLPDGVARTVLLEPPARVAPLEFARFRLSQDLPYRRDEAIVGLLPAGGGRVLAAAVRRAVVESYEAVVARAGLDRERVDLAPLASVAGLLRRSRRRELTVDLILGDAAYSLAVSRAGRLQGFRNRRRDPEGDTPERFAGEVDRAALLVAGHDAALRVRVVGSGAGPLVERLRAAGRPAEPAWSATPPDGRRVDAVELSWLGAAL
jgi:hypothetical protein